MSMNSVGEVVRMNTPEERAQLLAVCKEYAKRGEWLQAGEICEKVIYACDTMADVERATWMRQWARWIYQESLSNGRKLGPARTLLADAMPLAKTDYHLHAKLLIDQIYIRAGDDAGRLARQFWALQAKHPELASYRGHVVYNLGLTCSAYGRLDQAARYYKQASTLMNGRVQGWAYHNLAEVCAHLGRYRAAEAAAHKARPLLAPEDLHMHTSLMAYLSVLRGFSARGLAMIEEALGAPDCPPISRAHLVYYQALAYQQMAEYEQAEETAERAWQYASERHYVWLCDRLTLLKANLSARKGVS